MNSIKDMQKAMSKIAFKDSNLSSKFEIVSNETGNAKIITNLETNKSVKVGLFAFKEVINALEILL